MKLNKYFKLKKKENKNIIRLNVQSITSRMDTSIYTGHNLQLLPQTVDVWGRYFIESMKDGGNIILIL
jgi:hypothetical protein